MLTGKIQQRGRMEEAVCGEVNKLLEQCPWSEQGKFQNIYRSRGSPQLAAKTIHPWKQESRKRKQHMLAGGHL